MAQIAVIGPGAIGAIVATWLSQDAAHEVVVCARRPLSRLTVESADGAVEARVRFLTEPESAPAVDWIVVATKAYDAPGTAAWFPRLGARGAPAAIFQNGVEHRERFAPYLPPERIVPVIVDCPSERASPELIRQRGRFLFTVPDQGAGPAFAALFGATPFERVVTPDFITAAWRKLCLNAPGIVSALLLQPAGIFHDDAVAAAGREIVRESIAVGRAEGAVLPDDLPDLLIEAVRRAPRDAVNSLLADRMAGRAMEIDARNGAVVRFGRRHGIPTPYNTFATTLLESMARLARD